MEFILPFICILLLGSFAILGLINPFMALVLFIILLPFTNASLIIHMGAFDLSFLYLMGAILLGTWLVRKMFQFEKTVISLDKFHLAIGILLLFMAISAILSDQLGIGIKECVKILFFCTMSLMTIILIDDHNKIETLLTLWFYSIVICVIGSLVLFLLDLPSAPHYELTYQGELSFEAVRLETEYEKWASGAAFYALNMGFGNNPDKLAGLAVVGIILGIGLMQYQENYDAVKIFSIGILIIGLLMTYTRSAYLALFVGLFYKLIISKSSDIRWKIIFVSLIGMFFLIILFVGNFHERIIETFAMADASEYVRYYSWKVLLDEIISHPLFGIGPGLSIFILAPGAAELGWTDTDVDKFAPHNALLTFWSDVGTLGFLVFLWLIFIAMRADRRAAYDNNDRFHFLIESLKGAFLAWTVHVFFHPELTIWFWILLGLCYVMEHRQNTIAPRSAEAVVFGRNCCQGDMVPKTG